MHILPGDHRMSLQQLGLEHRAYEGRQRVLHWFSLEKRRGRANVMSSHSVVHKRQEDTICKKGHTGLHIQESFSLWGWSITGRGAWRCCLGNTQILIAQGTHQPALTGPASCRELDSQRSLPISVIPWVNKVFGRSIGLFLWISCGYV